MSEPFRVSKTEGKEAVLNNGITLYGDKKDHQQFQKIGAKYPRIWESPEFANVPEDNWMSIPLVEDWKDKTKFTGKVYPLGKADREVVDKTFDDLHRQGKMMWSKDPTLIASPVFVALLTVGDKRKGRVVILRGLNSVTVGDLYPTPLQSNILEAVQGCNRISTIDCTQFFY